MPAALRTRPRAQSRRATYPPNRWVNSGRKLSVWGGSAPTGVPNTEPVNIEFYVGRKFGMVVNDLDYRSLFYISSTIDYELGAGYAAFDRPVCWRIPLAVGANSSSIDITTAQAAAGALDAIWLDMCKKIATQRRGKGDIFGPGWEFNVSSFPWYVGSDGSGAANFIAAYRRFVNIARSVFGQHGTAFELTHLFDGGYRAPETCYPGDDVVDIWSMDFYWYASDWGYDGANFWNWALNVDTGGYNLTQFAAFAAAHKKRMAFPEFGFNSDAGALTLMAPFLAWCEANDVIFHSLWDTSPAFDGILSDNSKPNTGAVYKAYLGPPIIATTDKTRGASTAGSIILLSNQPAGHAVTWTIVGGADAGLFSITSGDHLTFGSIAASARVVTVRASVVDIWTGQTFTTDKTLTITFGTAPTILSICGVNATTDYRANAGLSQTSNVVTAWTDQRGLANFTPHGSPAYNATGFNGKPCVVLDGVDDGFTTGLFATGNPTGETFVYVGTLAAATAAWGSLIAFMANSNTKNSNEDATSVLISRVNNTNFVNSFANFTAGNAAALSMDTNVRILFVFDRVAGTRKIYINGVLASTATVAYPTTFGFSPSYQGYLGLGAFLSTDFAGGLQYNVTSQAAGKVAQLSMIPVAVDATMVAALDDLNCADWAF